MIKFTLVKGVDLRDGFPSLWLIRSEYLDGGVARESVAYLGRVQTSTDETLGMKAARIKQITLAKPSYYVYDNYSTLRHCDARSRQILDYWTIPS